LRRADPGLRHRSRSLTMQAPPPSAVRAAFDKAADATTPSPRCSAPPATACSSSRGAHQPATSPPASSTPAAAPATPWPASASASRPPSSSPSISPRPCCAATRPAWPAPVRRPRTPAPRRGQRGRHLVELRAAVVRPRPRLSRTRPQPAPRRPAVDRHPRPRHPAELRDAFRQVDDAEHVLPFQPPRPSPPPSKPPACG
jgi:hypothetical protein